MAVSIEAGFKAHWLLEHFLNGTNDLFLIWAGEGIRACLDQLNPFRLVSYGYAGLLKKIRLFLQAAAVSEYKISS
ncbi:MAG TPA: hypothetical protein PK198_27275, partial [Saprospiraceae bacterium]|nr:hypothetical protein [Saprospiraceae bacterium]